MKKVRLSLILISAILMFAGGMFLTSCDKTELVDSNKNEGLEENAEAVANIESYENLTVADMPQLEVREGMLYFDNSEQYFKTIAIVSKMTDEELDKWEQELSFVSLRTMQNKIWDELEYVEDKKIVDDIVNKYDKYIEFKEENGEISIIPIIENRIYASLINYKSLFLIREQVAKLTSEYICFTKIEDINEVVEIENNDVSKLEKNIRAYKYNVSNKTGTKDYGAVEWDDAIKDVAGSYCGKWRNDRRVVYKIATAKYSDGNYNFDFYVSAIVYGQRRYCDKYWRRYKTNLTMKEASCRVLYPYKSYGWNNFHTKWVDINFMYLWNGTNTRELLVNKYIGNVHYNTTVDPPDAILLIVNGKGSSRGVGNRWAVLPK